MTEPPVLAFDHVALVTGGVRLFDDLSFALAAGEQLAICGASGDGKSLVAKLALGLAHPLSGHVRLFGKPVAQLDLEALRRERQRCGLALQGGSLVAGLDVEDNLVLGIGAGGDARHRLRRKLDRIMLEFRIDHLAHADVLSLSAGERQRVELARALLRDPELAILDEPLAGVHAQADEIERQIRRQVHQRGRAMLLLTQDVALAERLCATVLRIVHGRLVRNDSVDPASQASA